MNVDEQTRDALRAEAARITAAPPPLSMIHARAQQLRERQRKFRVSGAVLILLLFIGAAAVASRAATGTGQTERIDTLAPDTLSPDTTQPRQGTITPTRPTDTTRPSGLPVESAEQCGQKVLPYVFADLPESFRTRENAFWFDREQRRDQLSNADIRRGPATIRDGAGRSLTLSFAPPRDDTARSGFTVLGAAAYSYTNAVDIDAWVGGCRGVRMESTGLTEAESQRIAEGLRPILSELYTSTAFVGLWPVTTISGAERAIADRPDGRQIGDIGKLATDFDSTAVLFGSTTFGSPAAITSQSFYDGRQVDIRLGDGLAIRLQTVSGTRLWVVTDFAHVPITDIFAKSAGTVRLDWGTYTGPRPAVYALHKSTADEIALVYLTPSGPSPNSPRPELANLKDAGPDVFQLPEMSPGQWRICTEKSTVNTCKFVVVS